MFLSFFATIYFFVCLFTFMLFRATCASKCHFAMAAPPTGSAAVPLEDDTSTVQSRLTVERIADTPEVSRELRSLVDFLQKHAGASPVDYFGQDVKTALQDKLPDILRGHTPKMNELVTLLARHYSPSDGDVEIGMSFATMYTAQQGLAALVGTYDSEGNANWTILNARIEEGLVKIKFPQSLMQAINGMPIALTVFNG